MLEFFKSRLELLTGVVLALTTFVAGTMGLWNKVRSIDSRFYWLLMVVAILGLGALGLRRTRSARSRLVEPESFILQSNNPEHLRGRSADLEQLVSLCRVNKEVLLTGASGVGKTALVRAGLCRNLESSELLPIYIDHWSQDWQEGPRTTIADQIINGLDPGSRDKLQARVHDGSMTSLLSACRDLSTRTPLLIFDQFDDYQVQHIARFLAPSTGSWLRSQELAQVNPFWSEVTQLLCQRVVHVLFVARSDAEDRIPADHVGGNATFRLGRISSQHIPPLLATLTAPREDGGEVVLNPDRGWAALQEKLTADLSVDGSVLPIQLRIALQGLEALPHLTPLSYVDAGGVRGLEAAAIHQALLRSADSSNLPPEKIRQALGLLVDPVTTKGTPRTTSELAQGLGIEDVMPGEHARGSIDAAMQALVHRHVVRQGVLPGGDSPTWMLDHDYLGPAALAVASGDTSLLFLEERFRAFKVAAGLRSRWALLLKPLDHMRLMGRAIRGFANPGGMRGYLALSLFRFAPYVVAALVPIGILGADCGVNFPRSGALRDLMYLNDTTVCQERFRAHVLGEHLTRLRSTLKEALASRRAGTWYQPTEPHEDGQVIEEHWIQAQALAAVISAGSPVNGVRKDWLTLYERRVRGPNGEEFGWLTYSGSQHTSAEPALWSAIALARIHSRASVGELNQIRIEMKTVHRIASLYLAGDGRWNMFPYQRSREVHSNYTAALALLALLETPPEVGWQDGRGRAQLRQRELIMETAERLIADFRSTSGATGWAATSAFDGEIQRGLTFQIYGTLLRAEVVGVRLPESILAAMVEALEQLPQKHSQARPFTHVNMSGILLTNHEGREIDSVVYELKFAWYPWAVDTAARLLDRAATRGATRRDLAATRRAFQYLVSNVGEDEVAKATRDFTFVGAETLFCLAGVNANQGR